jgi:hypothetical protein
LSKKCGKTTKEYRLSPKPHYIPLIGISSGYRV